MWTVCITAVTAFVATNVDDLLMLILFFSQTGRIFQWRHIIVGQYLGFLVLIAVSLAGFAGGQAVPERWMGLGGLVTIGIGVYRLFSGARDKSFGVSAQVQHLSAPPSWLRSFFDPKTYAVAAATVGNGSDNVSAYIPLFAYSSLRDLTVTLAIFLCLVAVWCVIAHKLTWHPAAAEFLSRYGRVLIPLLLIGLGVYIMYTKGTFGLLRL